MNMTSLDHLKLGYVVFWLALFVACVVTLLVVGSIWILVGLPWEKTIEIQEFTPDEIRPMEVEPILAPEPPEPEKGKGSLYRPNQSV